MIFGVSWKVLSLTRIYPNAVRVCRKRRTVARESPVASATSVSVIAGVCPKASITSRPRANDWTNSAESVSGCINEFDFRLGLQLVERQTKQGLYFHGAGVGESEDAVIGVQ